MKQTKLALSIITVSFLLSCSLFSPAPAPSAAAQPKGVVQTEIPTGAGVIPAAPTGLSVQPTESPLAGDNLGQIARAHLEALTAIGARPPGSENEWLAAEYINRSFITMGYQPEYQEFSANNRNYETFSSQNVIAVKPGDSIKEIIIGAHYDSARQGLGTDDNASGVAVMQETAERIAKMQTAYTIRFIAFGSEENGLDGSSYFAENMSETDVENTLAMVNLDSLAAGDITYVYSEEGEKAFLRDWLLEWAGKNDIPLQTIRNADLTDNGNYLSDYGAFSERSIPFIYFEATNWTLGDKDGWTQVNPQYGDEGYIWHTPFDNLEYLEATFPGRVNEHLKIFVSALFAITTEYK